MSKKLFLGTILSIIMNSIAIGIMLVNIIHDAQNPFPWILLIICLAIVCTFTDDLANALKK